MRNNKNSLYISTHQYPFYPGGGTDKDKGDFNNSLNIPLPAGTNSEEYFNAFDRVLDRLVDYSNNTNFDESTRLAVDYSKLKNIRLIKPTLKRYLAGRVKTQFRRIDADEFTVAALLPVQRFKKASAKEVYSDSRKMI